jgi:hypothetical protein
MTLNRTVIDPGGGSGGEDQDTGDGDGEGNQDTGIVPLGAGPGPGTTVWDPPENDSEVLTLRFQRLTLMAPQSRVEVRFAGPMEIVTGKDSQRVDERTYRGNVQLLPKNLKLRGPGPVTVTNLEGNALLSPGKIKVFVFGEDGEEDVPIVQFGDEPAIVDPGEAITIESAREEGEGAPDEAEPGLGDNYDPGEGDMPGTGINAPFLSNPDGSQDSGDVPTEGNDPPDPTDPDLWAFLADNPVIVALLALVVVYILGQLFDVGVGST